MSVLHILCHQLPKITPVKFALTKISFLFYIYNNDKQFINIGGIDFINKAYDLGLSIAPKKYD